MTTRYSRMSDDQKAAQRERVRVWQKLNPEKVNAKCVVYRNKRMKTHPELVTINGIRGRAKKLGRAFSIDATDIAPPPVCPILNIPLVRQAGKGRAAFNSPSVDCIVPALGYVRGNVQVISKRANTIKSDATFEELVLMGKWAEQMIAARKP